MLQKYPNQDFLKIRGTNQMIHIKHLVQSLTHSKCSKTAIAITIIITIIIKCKKC